MDKESGCIMCSEDDFEKILSKEIQRRRLFLEEYYDRCDDYCEDCIACQLWKLQDEWEQLLIGE